MRHGHPPKRAVMTGIGPAPIRQPRVRDREAAADGRIRFSPAILPPYMRRSKSIETLLPILYLKGISTGDFCEALAALLGKDAPGLSPTAIIRLKDGWIDEHDAWQTRDLSAKRYVAIFLLIRPTICSQRLRSSNPGTCSSVPRCWIMTTSVQTQTMSHPHISMSLVLISGLTSTVPIDTGSIDQAITLRALAHASGRGQGSETLIARWRCGRGTALATRRRTAAPDLQRGSRPSDHRPMTAAQSTALSGPRCGAPRRDGWRRVRASADVWKARRGARRRG